MSMGCGEVQTAIHVIEKCPLLEDLRREWPDVDDQQGYGEQLAKKEHWSRFS